MVENALDFTACMSDMEVRRGVQALVMTSYEEGRGEYEECAA